MLAGTLSRWKNNISWKVKWLFSGEKIFWVSLTIDVRRDWIKKKKHPDFVEYNRTIADNSRTNLNKTGTGNTLLFYCVMLERRISGVHKPSWNPASSPYSLGDSGPVICSEPWFLPLYWVGQKVCSGFFCKMLWKTRTKFLANPIILPTSQACYEDLNKIIHAKYLAQIIALTATRTTAATITATTIIYNGQDKVGSHHC